MIMILNYAAMIIAMTVLLYGALYGILLFFKHKSIAKKISTDNAYVVVPYFLYTLAAFPGLIGDFVIGFETPNTAGTTLVLYSVVTFLFVLLFVIVGTIRGLIYLHEKMPDR